MDLSLDDHRINNRATVIHRHKATDMHLARTPIDIYNADVAPKRIGEIGRIVVVHCLQAWLQKWWAICIGGKSQLLYRLTLTRCPLDEEAPWFPLEVIFTDLQ